MKSSVVFIPPAPTSERLRFSKSLFFQFEVGVEVDLRGIHGLVPQPHRNYRPVHAVLEEVHRGAVAQNVRGYTFVF